MKTFILAAALGATTLTGIAIAQTTTPTAAPAPRAARGDTNGDGAMTRTEFIAKAEQRFAMLDANKDGNVTREERRSAKGARGGKHGDGMRGARGGRGMKLERMDTDGDGRVSRAEALSRPTQMFDRADTNKDGFIDANEREAAKQAFGKRGQARGSADGTGGDMPPPPPEGE